MATLPEGFDLELLLQPIAGDDPTGPDLRQDYAANSVYYRLRDARAEARAAERAADNGGGDEAAAAQQWRQVRTLALGALAERSKDVELGAWLAESLLRSDGLAGLAAAFTLLGGLVDGFWDQLHPMPEEDGLYARMAPLAGLNGDGGEGTLMQPLQKLVLFQRPDGTPVPLWSYDQSVDVHGIGDATRKAARLAAGVIGFDTLEQEARAAGPARFAALRRDARAAAEAWQTLTTALDARAGSESPPSSQLRGILEHVVEVAGRYAPAEADADPAEPATDAPAAEGVPARGGPSAAPAAAAFTREDALRSLGELADFFRRTEPHSPLAYTLSEAVRRGRMGWPELLAEIVPDGTTRAGILTSLGIRPPDETA